MSDSDDFPKLHNDGETSESEIEDYSDENESENSENSSNCEEQISASNLVEALREAGKNTTRFDNISECDRLEDDFLIDAFKKVRFFWILNNFYFIFKISKMAQDIFQRIR